MNSLRALISALVLTTLAPAAMAQTPPPGDAPPPAGYAPPPAGYTPPPAGYAPPGQVPYPAYGAPPAPTGPRVMPYEDGYPVPDGYHPTTRVRTGLVIGGAITFGLPYLITATTGGSGGEGVLVVPLAGPFIEIGRLHAGGGSGDKSLEAIVTGILVVDGLMQVGGAAMLIAGLVNKKKVLVRDDVAKSTWHVTPLTMGQGGVGFGIVGTM